MADICGDNRFEIIAKAKEALIDSTNIETSPEEMAVLDNFLFRCWQMGWLDRYDEALEQTRWIPVTERLPENEQEVEITYTSKHWKTGEPLYFTCRAFYTDGNMNTEDSSYAWNEIDNLEYNENLGAYIIPEGWWEVVSFAEEFSCVDQPVIAWMPLPEPYKAGEKNEV